MEWQLNMQDETMLLSTPKIRSRIYIGLERQNSQFLTRGAKIVTSRYFWQDKKGERCHQLRERMSHSIGNNFGEGHVNSDSKEKKNNLNMFVSTDFSMAC